jgi:hypothetical protein
MEGYAGSVRKIVELISGRFSEHLPSNYQIKMKQKFFLLSVEKLRFTPSMGKSVEPVSEGFGGHLYPDNAQKKN